jgi:hypothetical protein
MLLTRIKTALKSQFPESRSLSKGTALEIVDPARLFQWAVVLRKVRYAYAQAHDGRRLRLVRPERYTDKMQWRKLFDLNPLYAVITDKLAVRRFVAKRVDPDVLVPLLWSGADPMAIPFDTLKPPYVVKSTHASGHVMLVKNKQTIDVDAACNMFRNWLMTCYGTEHNEPGYIQVPRRLIVERMLLCSDGSAPIEHRFFALMAKFASYKQRIETLKGLVTARFRAKTGSHLTGICSLRIDLSFSPSRSA